MAIESENMDQLNPLLTSRDTSQRWSQYVVFPMLLQTYLLDNLTSSLVGEDGTYFEDNPQAIYVIVGIIIFVYESFTQLMGPSLWSLYCLCQTDFSKHPSTRMAQITGWVLYLSDLFIDLRLMTVAPWLIHGSKSRIDLVLNVLAISFIRNIDNSISTLLSQVSFGSLQLNVPQAVVPDEHFLRMTMSEPSSLTWAQKNLLRLKWIVDELFLDVPMIPVVLGVVMYLMLQVDSVVGTDLQKQILVFLVAFIIAALGYKTMESSHVQKMGYLAWMSKWMSNSITVLIGCVCMIFILNNAIALSYSVIPAVRSHDIPFLFAGMILGDTPAAQAAVCSCFLGFCDQSSGQDCSCEKGFCYQVDCLGCSCEGGGCDQSSGCMDCTCDGGKCDQTHATAVSCNGGRCSQKYCNFETQENDSGCSCDGGACDQTHCNQFASGDKSGGCTCNGGHCPQTHCNEGSSGDDGGCSCSGGNCDQKYCNAKNNGTNGGCTCDGGDCSQRLCNTYSSGDDGGCTCDGGHCSQYSCNEYSSGDDGGCTCDGGACNQEWCSADSSGDHGGCSCDGGRCNQQACGSKEYSSGDDGGCTCDGGECSSLLQMNTVTASPRRPLQVSQQATAPSGQSISSEVVSSLRANQADSIRKFSPSAVQVDISSPKGKKGCVVKIVAGTFRNSLGVITRFPAWYINDSSKHDGKYLVFITEKDDIWCCVYVNEEDFELMPSGQATREDHTDPKIKEKAGLQYFTEKNKTLESDVDVLAMTNGQLALDVLKFKHTTHVNLLEHGPVLAILYQIASESNDNTVPNVSQDSWQGWVPIAIFSMLLQTYLLDKFSAHLAEDGQSTYFFLIPGGEPDFVIAGIMVFLLDAFTHLMGSSLLSAYCLCETDYSRHSSPQTVRCMGWVLYLSNLFIELRVILTSPWSIQSSAGRVALLLNVVGLSFILRIDDCALRIFSHITHPTVRVPRAVIPDQNILHTAMSTPHLSTKTQKVMMFLKWLFTDFFVHLPVIPAAIAVMTYLNLRSGIDISGGRDLKDRLTFFLVTFMGSSVVYKMLESKHVSVALGNSHSFRVFGRWVGLAIALAVGLFVAFFCLDNAVGISFSTIALVRSRNIEFLFAGIFTGDAPVAICNCILGYCDQSGSQDCSCEKGFCYQVDCLGCSCEGGGCDQSSGCMDCTCDGGKCDQTHATAVSCNGGRCSQKFCNFETKENDSGCSCDGGECDQTHCNQFASGDKSGGCTCNGGNCPQTHCNEGSSGDDGGCSCSGGNCDQEYCNAKNNGTNGGCTCDGGDCSQEWCNQRSLGEDGGCSCDGGGCDQWLCNFYSSGDDGGCTCDGGDCFQGGSCSQGSTGDHPECTCYGGGCSFLQVQAASSGPPTSFHAPDDAIVHSVQSVSLTGVSDRCASRGSDIHMDSMPALRSIPQLRKGSLVKIVRQGKLHEATGVILQIYVFDIHDVSTLGGKCLISITNGAYSGSRVYVEKSDIQLVYQAETSSGVQSADTVQDEARKNQFDSKQMQLEETIKTVKDESAKLKLYLTRLDDPSQQDSSSEVGTTTVNAFSHGPVLAVLYMMSCESENLQRLNPVLTPQDSWNRWCHLAVFPMLLQTYLLDNLMASLIGRSGTYFYEYPQPIYVIVGIIIFLFEAFTYLIGSSLLCLLCVSRTDYSKHPRPHTTRLMAWVLYLSDLLIELRVAATAPWFLQASASRSDLILNVAALSFILSIDDYALQIFSYVSFRSGDIVVPATVVPDHIFLRSVTSSRSIRADGAVAMLKQCFDLFFFDIPLIPITLAVLMYLMLRIDAEESNLLIFLAVFMPVSLAYKFFEGQHLLGEHSNASWFRRSFRLIGRVSTIMLGVVGAIFTVNNALGVLFSWHGGDTAVIDVKFIFAGLVDGEPPGERCYCLLGFCDQSSGQDCSCEKGFCYQVDCLGCSCEGGGCDQSSGCMDCTCDGGKCDQTHATAVSCNGGLCSQKFCNFETKENDSGCSCDGGECDQTHCNQFASGDKSGGCTCNGGDCPQTHCNEGSSGDDGGCSCSGGNCDQKYCNANNNGTNGGCSCDPGGCVQTHCNYASSGEDGGCSCAGGDCGQEYCNAESSGDHGGCSCAGGGCVQRSCNAIFDKKHPIKYSSGDDGGCTCDGGGCDQGWCNTYSLGHDGGCNCDGGGCNQRDCNFESLGDDGGCSCAGGGCDQHDCNTYSSGHHGGCTCDGGGCVQELCNIFSFGDDGGCTCDGGGCDQEWCNQRSLGEDGGCSCDGGGCDQGWCNGWSTGDDGGCSCDGGSCNQEFCSQGSTGDQGECTCDGGECSSLLQMKTVTSSPRRPAQVSEQITVPLGQSISSEDVSSRRANGGGCSFLQIHAAMKPEFSTFTATKQFNAVTRGRGPGRSVTKTKRRIQRGKGTAQQLQPVLKEMIFAVQDGTQTTTSRKTSSLEASNSICE